MTLIVDEVMLREPNLLVPRKKPVGSVRVDFSNTITKGLKSCLPFNPATKFYDIASMQQWVPASGFNWMTGKGYFGYGGLSTDVNNYIKSTLTNSVMGLVDDVTIHARVFQNTDPLSNNVLFGLNSTTYSDWAYVDLNVADQVRCSVGNSFTSSAAHSSNYFLNKESTFDVMVGSSTSSIKKVWTDNLIDINTTGQDTTIASETIGLSRVDDQTTSNKLFGGFWVFFCAWDRHLSEAERLSMNADPYQFLIPA